MPYIRKHYTGDNSCFSTIDGTKTILNSRENITIPNIKGELYRFQHSIIGSQILGAMLGDLLTDAGIAFEKINDYTFNIWGLKFSLLWLSHSYYRPSEDSNRIIYAAALVPYEQANVPCFSQYPTNTDYSSDYGACWSVGWTSWCPVADPGKNKNDINTYGYLYYNDNCIQFEVRSHPDFYGGMKVPIFYIFKGNTIRQENIAVLGVTPCSWYKTMPSNVSANCWNSASGTGSSVISRSMLFNLDNISKTILDDRTYSTSYNGADNVVINIGRYESVSNGIEENIFLYPLNNLYYDGYVKINNVYYVDQYDSAPYNQGDGLYGKILEINGNQYYIPSATLYVLDKVTGERTDTYSCRNKTTVPIAIKL